MTDTTGTSGELTTECWARSRPEQNAKVHVVRPGEDRTICGKYRGEYAGGKPVTCRACLELQADLPLSGAQGEAPRRGVGSETVAVSVTAGRRLASVSVRREDRRPGALEPVRRYARVSLSAQQLRAVAHMLEEAAEAMETGEREPWRAEGQPDPSWEAVFTIPMWYDPA